MQITNIIFKFQFHKGTIKTTINRDSEFTFSISIP